MDAQTLLLIFSMGIALSMDAFAVSVTDGLVYSDVDRKKSAFIAGVFGVMQALMPLVGFFLVEGITVLVGETAGAEAGEIMSLVVCWIAFALLLFLGGKMFFEALFDIKKPAEEKPAKKFSVKEVLVMGVATSIDALADGVSLHAGISTTSTVFLHVAIIMVTTFVISLIGLTLCRFFEKLFKGKYEVTGMVGGLILVFLGIYVVLSHYGA